MTLPVILRPAADADIQAIHDELDLLKSGLDASSHIGYLASSESFCRRLSQGR
jgi:hypothetical protein